MTATNEPEPPAPAAATGSAGRIVRVLVVDDTVDTAECIVMSVETLGHTARMEHSGAAALEAVRRYHPDLMFIDIGMPRMNGYELARLVRADRSLSGIRLVALSGYDGDEDLHSAQQAGFECHLVKPVSLDTIEALLNDMSQIVESARRSVSARAIAGGEW